jgi:hypothetical protein
MEERFALLSVDEARDEEPEEEDEEEADEERLFCCCDSGVFDSRCVATGVEDELELAEEEEGCSRLLPRLVLAEEAEEDDTDTGLVDEVVKVRLVGSWVVFGVCAIEPEGEGEAEEEGIAVTERCGLVP